jgi:hypothetical protein
MSEAAVLKVPAPEVSDEVKREVERVLTQLAPVVAARVQEKQREDFRVLVEALMRGVELRPLDVQRADMQARALQAVLEGTEWLTAEEIGQRGQFSASNLAAPAHRWKQEGKIFAISHGGQERFPRYALDEVFRPLPIVAAVLKLLGAISPWRIAVWFDSSNAWLDGAKPREQLMSAPERVRFAAERYLNLAHG